MPLNLSYTKMQKSQKWPKTQIKGGGSCLNPLSAAGVDALPLRVVFKNSKLRNSFFALRLTASWVAYLY